MTTLKSIIAVLEAATFGGVFFKVFGKSGSEIQLWMIATVQQEPLSHLVFLFHISYYIFPKRYLLTKHVEVPNAIKAMPCS